MSLAGGSFTSLLAFGDVNAPFNGADALETFELPADLGNLLADWPANVGMLSVGVGSLGSLTSLTAPQLVGMGMPELIELDIPGQLATFDALGVLDEVCQLLYLGVGGAACSP